MIVLIDDNEEFRQALNEYIRRLGLTVKSFSTAEHALVAIEQERASLELLITDVKLPGMSGLSLIKTARQFDPLLSVIVISSYAHEKRISPVSARQAYTAFLKKPVPLHHLRDTISEALHWSQAEPNRQASSHDDDAKPGNFHVVQNACE